MEPLNTRVDDRVEVRRNFVQDIHGFILDTVVDAVSMGGSGCDQRRH